jgi:hypothetical protein
LERHPEVSCNLIAGLDPGPGRKTKHEWPDNHRGKHLDVWKQIVQLAEQRARRKGDAGFLQRLPACRIDERDIRCIPSTARERHLPRPRVLGPLGPPDEEEVETGRPGSQDQPHSGLPSFRFSDPPRGLSPEASLHFS